MIYIYTYYADLTAAIPHSCLNGVQAVKDMNTKSKTAACNLGSDHTHQGKPQLQQNRVHIAIQDAQYTLRPACS